MPAPDQHPLDSQLDLHLVHWFPLIRISQNPVQPDFRLFVHLAARRLSPHRKQLQLCDGHLGRASRHYHYPYHYPYRNQ